VRVRVARRAGAGRASRGAERVTSRASERGLAHVALRVEELVISIIHRLVDVF
jgi:hypothetical protein